MKLGVERPWRRAIEALEHVKNNGVDPYNITVGRYNIGTDHLKQLLDYSKQKIQDFLNVAVPAGMWQKMDDIICNDEDRMF